jgi:hypothetical protein
MAIRESMHQVGGVILGKILNAQDRGYRGWQIDCGQGHSAEFVEYRSKQVQTVLGPVAVERAYYGCRQCGRGLVSRDQELTRLQQLGAQREKVEGWSEGKRFEMRGGVGKRAGTCL